MVLDDAGARRLDLEGLLPFTRYSVSVQVVNPEGVGPTATCTVSTDEGGAAKEEKVHFARLSLSRERSAYFTSCPHRGLIEPCPRKLSAHVHA